MLLSVFHTPELVPSVADSPLPDCAVVVDVLRATTTIATALAAGAEAVQVFADLDQLHHTSEQWPAGNRIRSGERGGTTVEGFDLGNSPLDYTSVRVKDKRIFMSTTNGTRSLHIVQAAPVVVTAALVNLGSVVEFLQANSFETVWIVGSGWQGSYSLEDTVCAGAIAHALGIPAHPAQAGNDEAIAAAALYDRWQDDLIGLLRQASHGQRLLKISLENDVDLRYCAARSSLNVVPRQQKVGVLMA